MKNIEEHINKLNIPIEGNPFNQYENSYRLNLIEEHFAKFLDSTTRNENFLPLWKYIDNSPEKFYSEKAFNDFYNFLNDLLKNNKPKLIQLLKLYERDLNTAFVRLQEINQLDWHDNKIKSNDKEYEFVLFIENEINPTFLKLIEAVFSNLIAIIGANELLNNNKKLEGFNLHNRLDILTKTPFKYLVFDNLKVYRNAIAHGSYFHNSCTTIYKDKNDTVEVEHPYILAKIDTLIDYCNGLALALSMFFFEHTDLLTVNYVKLPDPLLIEQLKCFANCSTWKINACLKFSYDNQLHIYIDNNLINPWHVNYFTLYTAKLLGRFAPNYERYFISLNSKYSKCSVGWAIFDGKKLSKISKSKLNKIENYYEALEQDKMIFFVPKISIAPIFFTIFNFIKIAEAHFKVRANVFKYCVFRNVKVRYTRAHYNGMHLIIHSRVVIEDGEDIEDYVRQNIHKIVKKAIKETRKKKFIHKFSPLGYIQVSLYRKDARKRTLLNSGLVKELIGTATIKNLKRMQVPDIYGGTLEIRKNIRLVWNKHFLNNSEIDAFEEDYSLIL